MLLMGYVLPMMWKYIGLVWIVPLAAEEPAPPRFTDYYESPGYSVTARVPQYTLPLDIEKVSNWQELSQRRTPYDVTRIRALLERNGFGVMAVQSGEDMAAPYRLLKEANIPVFVTADTLLHLYHVQFGETLREIEETQFYPLARALTAALLEDANTQRRALTGNLGEAARRNAAFFSVAARLLDPQAATPPDLETAAGAELERIAAHSGFSASPIFVYEEDYSQYVPRGHYTRSETLERYFRALMWYGRMGFLLKSSELLPPPHAEMQTLGAALIASALPRVAVGGRTALDVWNRIYTVTAFYVGVADDLTPQEYRNAIADVAGAAGNAAMLADPALFQRFRAALANLRNPRIYGGTGNCEIGAPFDPAQIDECLDKSKGMRLMGQRFVPDSYLFQNLVGLDYVGKGQPFTMVQTMLGPVRGFPRGLDWMDILGSRRAAAILEREGDTEYALYHDLRRALAGEFAALGEADWNRNLYWGWLHALKPLVAPFPEGYPTFMRTEAWEDKSLHTALASWTELRHDTILYAKQSYTPVRTSLPPPARGYVEPVPEFYARLLALTRMTTRGLDAMEALSAASRQRLDRLAALLDWLLDLSLKELRNEPLTAEENDALASIATTLEAVVAGLPDASVRTTLVADVHTDGNTGMVLEQGVGKVDMLAAVAALPDGTLRIFLGPVLSYFEFKQPAAQRLTDEAWLEMLEQRPPVRSKWTESFLR